MSSSFNAINNVAITSADINWGSDLNAIYEILSHRFNGFNENGFYAHPEEVSLRAELSEVGALGRLTRQLRGQGTNGVVLGGLGLQGLSEDRRNAALYALTLMLGFPTSTDQRTGRVAWDVKSRPEAHSATRFTTFSERVGSADMHTDSSFYPMPEEQFILYVVQAADCQGGHSLLIDGEAIYQTLQQTAAGQAAYELLSETPVPFRVPAVYAAGDAAVEHFVAPVFGPPRRDGDRFTLRWRYDAIQKGLAVRPDLSTPALVDALALLNEVAEHSAPRFKQQLPTDTLLWADNHRVLHGRTTYTDERRHLIRIRMSDVPNAERIGPSGVVRD